MEPMNLGSPVNSPGANQSQYLPPFLMGDPQALTPHNNTLSPKPGRYNANLAASPSNSPPHEFNRSTLSTRTLFGGAGGSTNTPSSGGYVSGTASAQHSIAHQSGPPTNGLFDSLREETYIANRPPPGSHLDLMQTPLSQLNITPYNMSARASNFSLNQSYAHPSNAQLNDSYVSNAPNAINASMRALCSPLGANMSPMLSTPVARSSDFWVTIFGFAPGTDSMILQQFTMCGTIVDAVQQNGNWMHVRFSSRTECDKALNYNHKIIAGNVMIGVTRCTDMSIIDKENYNLANQSDNERFQPKLRPITKLSYNTAQLENSVTPTTNVPQKSSGLVNKAMDLIFGW